MGSRIVDSRRMQIRVALAQINPKSGDIHGNAGLILDAIRRAATEGVQLVVLPEMCLTGYCLDEKLLINRRFLRENRRVLEQEVAPACRETAAVVGFVDYEEELQGPDRSPMRYNAAAVLHHGRLQQIVHKRLLPSYRYFDDKRYFAAGKEVDPVRLRFPEGELRLGVLICEDLWDDRYELKPCRIYAEKGVDLLACINASPFVCSSPGGRDGKRFERERIALSKVRLHGVPLVWVNTVGVGDNGKNVIPFDGASAAWDSRGERVAQLALFRPDYQTVVFEEGRADPVPAPEFDREGEIFDALVMSVRDYYDKIGIFNGVLEAVSGGIDSALGTAIASAAVGSERVTAFNLPSRYNSDRTRDAARRLAENFGIEYKVVPIQELYEKVCSDFERYVHPIHRSITRENLQARIRGLIMMAESNDREALLLTNGNESEIALGYATLYGDMVGGLAVIGDLPKPDVYRVARYVNRRWGREMIPEDSFRIPASAELKEDQVDPFDYEAVGPVVSEFIERGAAPDDLAEAFQRGDLNPARFAPEIYRRYDSVEFSRLVRQLYRTLNRSVYKRMQAAPIVVVSERSFGFDLRETIINGWTDA
ncbi:MAG: NAD+ synthase [Acidobacteriota bacterium]